MKRFLAATDGTRYGEHAVAIASSLAQRAGGELARFEVEAAVPSWEPGLERWREATTAGGTTTRIRGLPGIEIVHQAESWGADLVVLGRPEHLAERAVTLGPTSDTVIRRRAGVSLFVPPQTHGIKRVLIALDGSFRGLGALGPTKAFLQLTGARAFAICVLPGPEPGAAEASVATPARSELARVLVERLQLASGPCDFLVRWGDPLREILTMRELTRADLLVLGVRRGGAPGDLGSGHVGRDLLQTAPCAVLTVPI